MNLDWIKALLLGLSRLAASAGGMYLLTKHEYVLGASLLSGAVGFSVVDKAVVAQKIQTALETPPPLPKGP